MMLNKMLSKIRENLQAFDFSYFLGKSHLEEDNGTKNILVFLPVFKFFRKPVNSSKAINRNLNDSYKKTLNLLIHQI